MRVALGLRGGSDATTVARESVGLPGGPLGRERQCVRRVEDAWPGVSDISCGVVTREERANGIRMDTWGGLGQSRDRALSRHSPCHFILLDDLISMGQKIFK